MDLLGKRERLASKGMDVVDLRGCSQGTDDIGALGGDRVRIVPRDWTSLSTVMAYD